MCSRISRFSSQIAIALTLAIFISPGVQAQIWTEAGTGGASGNGLSVDTANPPYDGQVVLSINSSNEPVAVYSTYNPTSNRAGVHARVLRSGAWQATASGSDTGVGIAANCWKVENLRMTWTGGSNMFAFWNKSNAGTGPSFYLTGLSYDGSGWSAIGGSDTPTPFGTTSGGYYSSAEVTADADGHPVVFYSASTGIYVKRFDGTNWVEMGTGSATGAGVFPASFGQNMVCTRFKPGAQPTLFWGNAGVSQGPYISAMRWNGTTWEKLPSGASSPVISSSSFANYPAACIAADGQPVLVGAGSAVLKFNGSTWQTLGTNSLGFSYMNVAAGPDGTLLAAGVEPTSMTVAVRRYRPATDTWELLGLSASPSTEIGQSVNLQGVASPGKVGLAIDSAGTAYVSWVDVSNHVYAKKSATQTAANDWSLYQ